MEFIFALFVYGSCRGGPHLRSIHHIGEWISSRKVLVVECQNLWKHIRPTRKGGRSSSISGTEYDTILKADPFVCLLPKSERTVEHTKLLGVAVEVMMKRDTHCLGADKSICISYCILKIDVVWATYLCRGLARNTFANVCKIDKILAIQGYSWSGPAMKTPLGVKLVVESPLERSYLNRHRATRIKPLVHLHVGILLLV